MTDKWVLHLLAILIGIVLIVSLTYGYDKELESTPQSSGNDNGNDPTFTYSCNCPQAVSETVCRGERHCRCTSTNPDYGSCPQEGTWWGECPANANPSLCDCRDVTPSPNASPSELCRMANELLASQHPCDPEPQFNGCGAHINPGFPQYSFAWGCCISARYCKPHPDARCEQ